MSQVIMNISDCCLHLRKMFSLLTLEEFTLSTTSITLSNFNTYLLIAYIQYIINFLYLLLV